MFSAVISVPIRVLSQILMKPNMTRYDPIWNRYDPIRFCFLKILYAHIDPTTNKYIWPRITERTNKFPMVLLVNPRLPKQQYQLSWVRLARRGEFTGFPLETCWYLYRNYTSHDKRNKYYNQSTSVYTDKWTWLFKGTCIKDLVKRLNKCSIPGAVRLSFCFKVLPSYLDGLVIFRRAKYSVSG